MTRNIRRLDGSTNDRYRVLQDPNRLAWAWSRAPFQFVTGLEHSATTEQSNVSARSSAVARFRFGPEYEHSGKQAVCRDPPVFADSSWEAPRAYWLDENTVDQSPAANRQTQTATPSRPANTAYIMLLHCGRALILETVLIKRIV